MADAQITLSVPQAALEPTASPPPTLPLGALEPGDRRVADWWVSVPADFAGPAGEFTLTAHAHEGGVTRLTLSEDTAIPSAQPHAVGISGAEWIEPGFRLAADVRPGVEIECLEGTVTNPTVGDRDSRVRYQGVLERGMRHRPGGSATLTELPLCADDGADRADADDPTGFRGFDAATWSGVWRCGAWLRRARCYASPSPAKVADGEQNHVILRFLLASGRSPTWARSPTASARTGVRSWAR